MHVPLDRRANEPAPSTERVSPCRHGLGSTLIYQYILTLAERDTILSMSAGKLAATMRKPSMSELIGGII